MKRLCAAFSVLALALLGPAACGPDNTNTNNSNNVDLCALVQCGANAHCEAATGDCACDEGYLGDPDQGCTEAIPCETDSCSGHGTCDDSSGAPVCDCDTGYAGDICDSCDTDYDLVSGSCVSSQLVDCKDITPPSNAHQLNSLVTITYSSEGGWTTPVDCAFACDTDFDLVDQACIDEREVDCAPITPPANAHQVEAKETITYTTANGWTTPKDCEWACNTDYDLVNGSCINSQQVACTPITPPSNAHQVSGNVTITYTSAGGWTTPADCGFACNTDYALVGGACVNTQQVDCGDITPPPNAHQVESQETITYTTAGGWTTPADCDWACNVDYDLQSGACINSLLVDCVDITPPANAHQVDGQVTITFTTSGGWTDPAQCDWACDTGFHRDQDGCIADVEILWCTVQWPNPGYTRSFGETETVYGQLWSTSGAGTSASGALPGVIGQLCYANAVPAHPTDLSAMTCLDATYNMDVSNNDEYLAALTLDDPGTYYYVYAFSGDGGDSWTVCDASGLESDPVRPGTATIRGCDLSGWQIQQANSDITYTIPAGTKIPWGGMLIVARDSTQADFESSWGVTLGTNVVYITTNDTFPKINGSETFTLYDDQAATVDGPTVAMATSGNQALNRTSTGPAGDAASWSRASYTTATPGTSTLPLTGAGVFISEFSDNDTAYYYYYEFVEIFCDE